MLHDGAKPIFLLGAGASKQSGIKLVVEIIEEAAKWAYCKQNGIPLEDPRLTMSDWKTWLRRFEWYTEDYSALYPIIIENLLNPRQARKDFFLKIISPGIPASKGYERLAELMALGLVDTVLTANFDNCLNEAKVQIRKPPVIQSIKTPDDLAQFSYTPRYPQLIYLHGSVEHYTDQNLNEEVQQLNKKLVQTLSPLLKDRPLVVIGYRGAEISIMKNLFLDNLHITNNFHQGIYWCLLKREAESLQSHCESFPPLFNQLREKTNSNFQIIPIDGFDELMEREIMGKLAANKIDLRNATTYALSPNAHTLTFENEVIGVATIGQLEFAVIRERIRNYSERLAVKVYDEDQWYYQQMVRLRIAQELNGKYELTRSGILLFSSKTQDYIPGSYTRLVFRGNPEWLQQTTTFQSDLAQVHTATTDGYIERVIGGNIWNQLNEISDALTLVNKPYRLKGEVSENVYPYPTLALKEIIVNSLVHRSFAATEPNVIEITPNSIKFVSAGGLVEEVKRQLTKETLEQEIRTGRRGIKGYRNPVIADLFYGAGAMDKEGSGLSDVVQEVTINSALVSFGPTPDESHFEVTIYRRADVVDQETQTARPLSVNTSTKMACNLFEVIRLPEKVYHGESLVSSRKELFAKKGNAWIPPFLLSSNRIWSFYDLSEGMNPLKAFVDQGTIEGMSLSEFLDNPNAQNDFVRLLNDSLADHLFSVGLRVDNYKKRAYFPSTIDGQAKEITYQARLKKATRTVAKPRVNLQTGRISYWEHKSMWYRFEKIGGNWYLMINPSYVFTKDGFKALLNSDRVNILSTKKASRDYNMSVHNDLTFWANYISLKNETAFLLRPNSREINDGTKLGPIQPDIVISSRLPTITINDISAIEEFVEPTDLEDIEAIEQELEVLASAEQANQE